MAKEYDYYILRLWRCIDPSLVGPFDTEEEALERHTELVNDPAECENSHTAIKVTKGADIDLF